MAVDNCDHAQNQCVIDSWKIGAISLDGRGEKTREGGERERERRKGEGERERGEALTRLVAKKVNGVLNGFKS